MSLRMIIAGIAGGVVMFVWMGLAHMVLGLGTMGVSSLNNEAPALSAMQAATGDHDGFYVFPYMDPHAKDRKAEMKAYEAKAAAGPSGMLVYHPAGHAAETGGKTMVEEVAKEIVTTILATLLLGVTTLTRYWSRAGFVAVVGLIATLTTNVSYLVWYGFPATYTMGNMIIEFVGYLVAGLVIAALYRPRLRVEI